MHCTIGKQNILQNISTFHIELLLAKINIQISMKWRLWISVFSWTWYSQLLTNIRIYTSEVKMIWKLPASYIIYIYIYITVCIILNKLYLVGCICGLYSKWIMKWQWSHPTICASPTCIWCMRCNNTMKPIVWLLMLYVHSIFTWMQTPVPTCEECICV